jgi:aldose 1-epimerase
MTGEKAYFKKENLSGIETIALTYEAGHKIECFIAPEYGANMVRMSVDGKNVIDFDAELIKQHGYTGTPVLFPTPNRVRDGKFTFNGRLFQYDSGARPAYEHGLVHYESWKYEVPIVNEDSVSLKLFLDCKKGTRIYKAFPIEHRINLLYTLYEDGIKIEYKIENKDSVSLPYGFALHPYFIKLSGDNGTYVKLPAKKYMQATEELLPTGKLIGSDTLKADVINGDRLGAMDFDHVFTDLDKDSKSEIWYEDIGFKIELSAGKTFSHIVFYTPKGEGLFCIENQTCSTDAHNMYQKGYKAESGLEIISPYGTKSDFIFYRVSDI